MTPTCVRCGRPTPDGYVDVSCGITKPSEHLRAIADMVPAARLVAAGLVRRGSGGNGSNKPGSRSPGNDDAIDALDEIQNALTTIARDIAETRGAQIVSTAIAGRRAPDPLAEVATWLCGQMEWVRHATDDQGQPYAVAVLDEIRECAGRMRRIVDGPPAQKYLGPCGAALQCEGLDPEDWPEGDCGDHTPHAAHERQACDGDVYARDGAQRGRCRTCGAEVARSEREAWLDGEVRAHAFRAAHIAQAYGLNVNTLRTWAHDRPARHDHAGTQVQAARPAKLQAHAHDLEGRPLFLVGAVLDLAAEEAARREGERAKRERRAAVKAEGERLSA